MGKPLDLNKTVYELTKEYPELVDIMKKLGFTEITNPAMLKSVGRMMTIPKGAKMKNISMIDVVTAMLQNGFQLVGEMPNLQAMQGGMPTAEAAPAEVPMAAAANEAAEVKPASTTEALKAYLKRLGSGEDLESVRADFVQNFSEVEASEIMKAEQELMKEGTPLQEVQQLCDVHSALFHGATREEKIANAEREVAASVKREQSANAVLEAKQKAESIAANAGNTTDILRVTEGHPLRIFSKENTAIGEVLQRLQAALNGSLTDLNLDDLRHLATHYAKKGDLLYPLLKVRYDISGPSDVMWTVDDEIRHEITDLKKAETRDEAWGARLKAVLTRAEEMIYKEENILLPICAENFKAEEWMGIYQDAKDYDAPFGITEVWADAENFSQNAEPENGMADGEVVMPGGHMTVEQLTAMLNTLPVEISFIDDQNINRYFNQGPKVFKRPQMALDREVFSCHPPKIEPIVREILDGFRNGKKDSVPVWMEKEGKPFLVNYMAVRNRAGKYLGTIEVVQDMSMAKEHFGK